MAKLHKIAERHATRRHHDKDALDVVRLLRGVETTDLAERMRRLLGDSRSAEVTGRALELLEALFGRRTSQGVEMATRAAGGMVDADELAVSCALLVSDLLEALR